MHIHSLKHGHLCRPCSSLTRVFSHPPFTLLLSSSSLQVLKSDYHDELAKYIDDDQLPKELGGTCECKDDTCPARQIKVGCRCVCDRERTNENGDG